MIYGVGTDICDVRRIAATLARRGERFAEKVLGPHEIEVFRQRRAKVEARGVSYLATRFSAKEAFSKAIGMGMRMPMTWRDCEVVKAPSGKPTIRLHGALAEWFEQRGLQAHVSVSDETDYAASFVVVEYRQGDVAQDDITRGESRETKKDSP
jgi:holo-[acyl-carrier protein] synthase